MMYHNLCVYTLSSFISKGVALVVVMLSLNQMFFLLNVLFDMPVLYCIWFSWNRDTLICLICHQQCYNTLTMELNICHQQCYNTLTMELNVCHQQCYNTLTMELNEMTLTRKLLLP